MPISLHIRSLAVAAIAVLLASPAQSQGAPRPVLAARLDSLVHAYLVDGPTVGVTAAVVQGHDTLYFAGAGEQDGQKHIPATRNTVYRIGSVTKQFTASAIMQLVESGRLHLGDTLGALLPQYPQWRSVTLRQLLNHTSGIHSYTSSREWPLLWNDSIGPARIIDFVARDTFDFAPGSQFRYNNSGYVLLGMILEKVTGTPYATLMNERFFRPLGLASAMYCPNAPSGPTHAAGNEINNGKPQPTRFIDMSHPYAAGGLCMSVPDFLRWQTALTSGKVVSPATYARMSTSDTLNSGIKFGYGFALFDARMSTHRLIHHGGDVPGFSTQQLWFPDDSLRVVVFSNTLGSNPDFLARNLASAVLGLPLQSKPRPPRQIALPVAERAKYTGTYNLKVNEATLPLKIWVEGDSLVAHAQAPGQVKFPLYYIGSETFITSADPSIRVTVRFTNGVATSAQLSQRGGTIEGERVP